jgi:glycosyltransferase involved in cell wall biosynthesis
MGAGVTIDVVVLTRDEAKNITDCLKSFQGLGRAVVIDDNSRDGTVEMALGAGAEVFTRSLDSFAAQRNFALTKVTADWVFFLDADERFTPELLERVRRFTERGPVAVGSVLRQNHAFGRRHRFGRLAPDRVTRLFPTERVRWEGMVHERPVSDLPVEPVGGHLRHYTYDNWPGYLDKLMKYARLWAEDENV